MSIWPKMGAVVELKDPYPTQWAEIFERRFVPDEFFDSLSEQRLDIAARSVGDHVFEIDTTQRCLGKPGGATWW